MNRLLLYTVLLGMLGLQTTTIAAPAFESDDFLLEEVLFEGDIIVPKKTILETYNLSSIHGNQTLLEEWVKNSNGIVANVSHHIQSKRAVGRPSAINLWTNSVVPYKISTDFPNKYAQEIRKALDHWEDHTCLIFQVAGSNSDYIEFVHRPSVCSSYIGRRGGRQTINLATNCSFGTIVHEIGHAIGFWHEQSRPDRDNYVTINEDNIQEGRENNFLRQSSYNVDSHGSTYDYGSIMHYYSKAFSKPDCSGDSCVTIRVNNWAEYNRQGRPTLGQRNGLSTEDKRQARALYNCQGRGTQGYLIYRVRYASSLKDTDPPLNEPDPYVKFTSIDVNGNHHNRQSSVKSGTRHPIWNEWVFVSEREWNFFECKFGMMTIF